MAFTSVTKATTLISGGWDAFNNLISDLLSTSNGKGASQIGVEDSAGYFTATNVEGVLAELRDDTSTTVTLAETFAENSATTTSLTWGFKGGLFRLDNLVTNVSSSTIGLTDDATNYVEINPSTGLMTKNTTSFTSGHIPIREVITASGSQTTSTDKRAWFSQVAAGTLATAGINNLSTSGSIKTDNYTVATSDTETQLTLGAATASDKIFTLLSVGESEDGMVVHFYNASNYKLTIKPSDTDRVWNSGEGYGIGTSQPGTFCSLRYDHSNTSWQPLHIGGGLWTVEELKLWVKGTELTVDDPDTSTTKARAPDEAKRHSPASQGGLNISVASPDKYPAHYVLHGTDEEIIVSDSPDWDVFADNTQSVTFLARVRFDATGSAERIIAQYEGASDTYFLSKSSADEWNFSYSTSLGTGITMTAGSVSATTWYNVVFVRSGVNCGLYAGTGNVLSQIAFEDTWTEDPGFAASLYIGQSGNDGAYFIGRTNDVVIAHQNLLSAAPVVGLTDTITIPSSLNLAIGGN